MPEYTLKQKYYRLLRNKVRLIHDDEEIRQWVDELYIITKRHFMYEFNKEEGNADN